ncbi:hypothetical protein GCM10010123_34700 [Pilimelia anulata]|uniref:Sulfatase N-terminal domain-containing protein n=1 Tax=Pilimelia anulata TaxID=53371 RepID=A0A8J3BD44_9ACTN|nr:sulfatase-like hydrolase/transferase [Pilimelia anulata]GGK01847.1 hypothetical protein GCM10010123_34700 [Pilimelia anulata]
MRAHRSVLAAAAVVLTTMAGGAAVIAAAPPQRPNVLVLLLDDARPESMVAMPRTRAWLGGNGRSYPNAVVTTPSCCPSRASIWSGRYAHNHGVVAQNAIGRLDHDRTVVHDLKTAGYRTAVVGKLFNAWKIHKQPPYVDRWALAGGGYDNALFNVDGKGVRARYSTTFIGEQINRYLDEFERDDNRPWFVNAGFVTPHSPFTPEPKYANVPFTWDGSPATREADRSDKPRYVRNFGKSEAEGSRTRQAQLRTQLSADDAIESIRRHLAARGELANTLVVFLSDNGKFWSEHGLMEKFMPYDAAERVPLLISLPGRIDRGTDNRLAANVDITPTILDAAGLAPSYATDGRSLLGGHRRDRILTEYWRDSDNGAGIPPWASTLVPDRYRYTEVYDDSGRVTDREYYDLAADPWQLTNLYGDRKPGNDPAVGPLAAALAAQRRCAGAACP